MGKTILNQLIDKALDGDVVKDGDISALVDSERTKAEIESADAKYAAKHKLGKVSDAWDENVKTKDEIELEHDEPSRQPI